MRALIELAWRDLRASVRGLWVFAACLTLGVSLVAAGGALFRQVDDSLRADMRALFGGDVEVRSRQALDAATLEWMRGRGQVSQLTTLRTMMTGAYAPSADAPAIDASPAPASGSDATTPVQRSHLVELQAIDAQYPLVGELRLEPPGPAARRLEEVAGRWGIAVDPVLAQRMGLAVGSRVEVGDATLEVRALIAHQPDRSLRADWNGAPVLVTAGALQATGLLQPFSRVDHRYRVRVDGSAQAWRDAYLAAHPGGDAELRTVDDRSERIADVLGQVGAGLLLVGLSALLIGGLGVHHSVQSWLQQRLGTLATLRAVGLRDGRLAALVLAQVAMLAAASSIAGAAIGAVLALAGLRIVSGVLPMAPSAGAWFAPLALAVVFGIATALLFALPSVSRALTVSPAALFRSLHAVRLQTPPHTRWAVGLGGSALLALLALALPDPRFAAAFVIVVVALLALLEGLMRLLQAGAGALLARPDRVTRFELRLALSNLRQPQSPMRPAVLALGSALTLLVTCAVVVAALLRTIDETVPRDAPAIVFHDVQTPQLETLAQTLRGMPSTTDWRVAPLVLGRLVAVNGRDLETSGDAEARLEARDEHKFSHRQGNIDDVVVTRGAWWPEGYRGPPQVAMEDREADELGLQVGDRLRFDILGTPVDAELVAIYAQRRLQSRLWLEAIFSDGVLDPHVTRHVGAAWMSAEDAIRAQDLLAQAAPNIASLRTASMLDTSRSLLGRASAGLAVVAGVLLAASLLVLASIVAAARARQTYEASVLHVLGTRVSGLKRVLRWEYALMALVTSALATLLGTGLASAALAWRIGLDATGLAWVGGGLALGVSALALGTGAQVLLARLRLSPATLLRGQ